MTQTENYVSVEAMVLVSQSVVIRLMLYCLARFWNQHREATAKEEVAASSSQPYNYKKDCLKFNKLSYAAEFLHISPCSSILAGK